MAKEHHCPNCGLVTSCNAATSKIHVCQRCGHRWEEDLAKVPVAKAA
jgi:ribosomal protein L37AE/L43A